MIKIDFTKNRSNGHHDAKLISLSADAFDTIKSFIIATDNQSLLKITFNLDQRKLTSCMGGLNSNGSI